MFSNLHWTNLTLLLLLALFIFGAKLPHILADGLRLLRNLRRMATNATSDLSRELGTDIRIEDLHPKTFLRKHVLNDLDTDALTKPLKGMSDDLLKEVRGVERDLRDVTRPPNELTREQRATNRARANTERNRSRTAVPGTGEPAAADPPASPARSYDDVT